MQSLISSSQFFMRALPGESRRTHLCAPCDRGTRRDIVAVGRRGHVNEWMDAPARARDVWWGDGAVERERVKASVRTSARGRGGGHLLQPTERQRTRRG